MKFEIIDHSLSIYVFQDHEVELYKYVFPLKYPSLAVIGLIQPIGSILPISEMQCRWVAAVFSGQIRLPLNTDMLADIKLKQTEIRKRSQLCSLINQIGF